MQRQEKQLHNESRPSSNTEQGTSHPLFLGGLSCGARPRKVSIIPEQHRQPAQGSWDRVRAGETVVGGSIGPSKVPRTLTSTPRLWRASQVMLVVKNPPPLPNQCRRHRFDPLVRKIIWKRKWQPTPGFVPGEPHGQRSLAGYSPRGRTELTWLNDYTAAGQGNIMN